MRFSSAIFPIKMGVLVGPIVKMAKNGQKWPKMGVLGGIWGSIGGYWGMAKKWPKKGQKMSKNGQKMPRLNGVPRILVTFLLIFIRFFILRGRLAR